MDILLSMHSSIFLRTELSFGHCMLPAPFSASRSLHRSCPTCCSFFALNPGTICTPKNRKCAKAIVSMN